MRGKWFLTFPNMSPPRPTFRANSSSGVRSTWTDSAQEEVVHWFLSPPNQSHKPHSFSTSNWKDVQLFKLRCVTCSLWLTLEQSLHSGPAEVQQQSPKAAGYSNLLWKLPWHLFLWPRELCLATWCKCQSTDLNPRAQKETPAHRLRTIIQTRPSKLMSRTGRKLRMCFHNIIPECIQEQISAKSNTKLDLFQKQLFERPDLSCNHFFPNGMETYFLHSICFLHCACNSCSSSNYHLKLCILSSIGCSFSSETTNDIWYKFLWKLIFVYVTCLGVYQTYLQREAGADFSAVEQAVLLLSLPSTTPTHLCCSTRVSNRPGEKGLFALMEA